MPSFTKTPRRGCLITLKYHISSAVSNNYPHLLANMKRIDVLLLVNLSHFQHAFWFRIIHQNDMFDVHISMEGSVVIFQQSDAGCTNINQSISCARANTCCLPLKQVGTGPYETHSFLAWRLQCATGLASPHPLQRFPASHQGTKLSPGEMTSVHARKLPDALRQQKNIALHL